MPFTVQAAQTTVKAKILEIIQQPKVLTEAPRSYKIQRHSWNLHLPRKLSTLLSELWASYCLLRDCFLNFTVITNLTVKTLLVIYYSFSDRIRDYEGACKRINYAKKLSPCCALSCDPRDPSLSLRHSAVQTHQSRITLREISQFSSIFGHNLTEESYHKARSLLFVAYADAVVVVRLNWCQDAKKRLFCYKLQKCLAV